MPFEVEQSVICLSNHGILIVYNWSGMGSHRVRNHSDSKLNRREMESFMKVEFKSSTVEYEGFVKIEKDIFQFERFGGGMSRDVTRYRYRRGDAVAVLIYEASRNQVLLIRQFRNAVHMVTGDGWLVECVAGMMEEGETPEAVAFREVKEETGLELEKIEWLTSYFFSPGGCSDRIHLFLGWVKNYSQPLGIHGLWEEGEEVLAQWIPLEEALAALEHREIVDAKAMMGLLLLERRLRAH
jgi:ADP-ribose pyrophosphatase